MADPTGRVLIAFDQPTLLYDCDWTRIDDDANLVASYQIDRGRQYELDRTDTGRATVQITDIEGVLDPTNPGGPYYGQIEPLLQIMLGRKNPVTGVWYTRFRGFIEDIDYAFDPSQKFNRLTITCFDLFEILAAIQMTPTKTGGTPRFGDDPAAVAPDSQDMVVFQNESMQDRVNGVLGDALGATLAADWSVCFTGTVELSTSTYSPTENIMSVIQEACDGEFPAVSNAYCEGRTGRLAVHGRGAKIDPEGTIAAGGPIPNTVWDWHHWHCGDGAAVNAGSGLAHLREFAFNRGMSKIINDAFTTPAYLLKDGVQVQAETDDWARTWHDASQAKYGIRSWSAENLLTLRAWSGGGPTLGSLTLTEIARFGAYYVANYHEPKNRVTVCGFASMRPEQPHAAATWDLLSQVEIADLISITVASPGGGGFDDESYFVEGVHETVTPLNPDYDLVRLTLDLSPQAYFDVVSMFDPDWSPAG